MNHQNYNRYRTIHLTKYELAGMLNHQNLDEHVLYEIAVRLNRGRRSTVRFFSAVLPAYGLTPEQVLEMFGF